MNEKIKSTAKIVIITVIVLGMGYWCFISCSKIMADTVIVTYVPSARTLGRSSAQNQVFSKEQNEINKWIDLMGEIDRRDLWTDDLALNPMDSFPCYMVEIRRGEIRIADMMVTGNKVAISSFFWGGRVIDYGPENPYYGEIGDRLAEMKSASHDSPDSVTDNEKASKNFELSDTFRKLLNQVNAAHEFVKLYDGDYYAYSELHEEPDFDFSQYSYKADKPSGDTVFTLDDLKTDLEIYYKGLRTRYGGYSLYGGDEAFRSAIDAIIADCAALDVITCADVEASVRKHFAFVKDAHFAFNNTGTGKYAVPFFFRGVAYQKTEAGYEGPDGKVVASVDGYDDLDELFKLSLTIEGDLVYSPILLESFRLDDMLDVEVTCSAPTLLVRYADGSTEELNADSYTHPINYTSVLEPLTIREENGVPIIAVNTFSPAKTTAEFTQSARTYRDRDLLVLDLRANSGGSILVGLDWVKLYSQQNSVWTNCLVGAVMPTEQIFESYKNNADGEFISMKNTRIMLTGKYTSSAAEGFVDLCYNMENTLIVGENTCGAYTCSGSYIMTLPNTGLRMTFGPGPMLPPEGDFFEELRGICPDIWVPQDEAEEAVMNFIGKNTTVK